MRFHRGRGATQLPVRNTGGSLDSMPPHVARNVEEIVRLEGRDRLEMGLSDHFADLITHFSGSMLFVWLHTAWFAAWIALNVVGVVTFDEFPFGFLTMTVSLEAIFLSTFVLISQNRQALQADRRARIDLQINMISEQEITKVMSLVADIHDHLGLRGTHDAELAQMQTDTHVEQLVDAIDQGEAGTDAATGPRRAADTEH